MYITAGIRSAAHTTSTRERGEVGAAASHCSPGGVSAGWAARCCTSSRLVLALGSHIWEMASGTLFPSFLLKNIPGSTERSILLLQAGSEPTTCLVSSEVLALSNLFLFFFILNGTDQNQFSKLLLICCATKALNLLNFHIFSFPCSCCLLCCCQHLHWRSKVLACSALLLGLA